MTVRRLRADEALAWRDVRLRALADSPDAFETTYADSARLGEEAWLERTGSLAEGRQSVMFVADEGGALVGAAGAFVDDHAGGLAHLISMWVAPEERGRGLGEALATAVVDWARERGCPAIRLFVVRGNGGATALYERCGFRSTGVLVPMPRRPTLLEEEMRLRLD
jgi:ribosomal protein S18 acetylase RimI-like enzyme